jgi:hypothetical protein
MIHLSLLKQKKQCLFAITRLRKIITATCAGLLILTSLSVQAQTQGQNTLTGILPAKSDQSNNQKSANSKEKATPEIFKKDKHLEQLVANYQQSKWAAKTAKLTEKALIQEYLALQALQTYLEVQQQQKQQRIQALMSSYQALKTQEAFKASTNASSATQAKP